jgi:dipeptidyl aminopeptidase/acylaminoacyl peptidase
MSRALLVFGLVILLSASGAGATSSSQTGASAVPPRGTLAYSLGGRAGGSISVWNLGAATTRPITPRLTRGERRYEGQLEWSPDGRRLAFVRKDAKPGRSGLFVVGVGGTGLRKVLPLGSNVSEWGLDLLRWSPDGTRLVFDRYGAHECDVSKPFNLRFSVARANGTGLRDIPALPKPSKLVQLGNIVWSPSGRELFYSVDYAEVDDQGGGCRFHRNDSRLYRIGVDGRGRRLIASRTNIKFALSPDGRRIASVGDEGVYVAQGDGKAGRVVCSGCTSAAAEIAWNPNGTEVLTLESDGLEGTDAATGKQRTIVPLKNLNVEGDILAFSKDGRTIGFLSELSPYSGDVGLFLASLEDGAPITYRLPPTGLKGSLFGLGLHLG